MIFFRSRFGSLLLWGLAACVVGFVGIQFIRPSLPNPPVIADLQAPMEVKQILQTSCYNCHSNQTKLAWFDRVVPAYWMVVRDVRTARRHMNFSNFGKLSPAQQKGFLYEAVNQVQLGAMPLPSYRLVHPESVITPEQLVVLKKYLHPDEMIKPADPAQIAAADAQYQKWTSTGTTSLNVSPAPNGLVFFPDYKNWKPISTTDRFDNNTLRVILGNDVAIKAISENNVRPWPDGAAFAKIAYQQMPDGKGLIQAGSFIQVEFMLRDANKYAATQGWGFGRWKGDDLVPYGKKPTFTVECTSCHAPVAKNDFVYTMPIRAQAGATDAFNRIAALPDDLPYQPLQWKVITSAVDRAQSTMSTLYGNDLAVTHARTDPKSPYPAGAVLSLVTWQQQEDRHWFGARIPGQVQSVEFVSVEPGSTNNPAYLYQAYTGAPLQKQNATDAAATQGRVETMMGLRASVMP